MGVFVETDGTARDVRADKKTDLVAEKDVVRLTVLVVHPTPESVTTLPARLAADDGYRQAAADYLAAKADDPAYLRITSSLFGGVRRDAQAGEARPVEAAGIQPADLREPQRAGGGEEGGDVRAGASWPFSGGSG